ncbi:MAG: type IIL restriction-modification enzyme MmeI [Candidatus Competibacteraceae bacterium]
MAYNNFPWTQSPTDKQQLTIEIAAQAVFDAHAQFPDFSLADLYDPLSIPERDRIAFLFALYSTSAVRWKSTKPRAEAFNL